MRIVIDHWELTASYHGLWAFGRSMELNTEPVCKSSMKAIMLRYGQCFLPLIDRKKRIRRSQLLLSFLGRLDQSY